MKRKKISGVSLLLSILCTHLVQAAERPNILMILADDLGYGDVSYLNPDSKITTPNIDQLARDGIYLTDAHSAGNVCTPSRYALLTGAYPWRPEAGRASTVVFPWEPSQIPAHFETLPKLLKKAGYDTACIGKWHLGWDWPFAEGITAEMGLDRWIGILGCDSFDFTKPIKGGPIGAGFDYYFGDDVPNFPPFAFIENDRLTCTPIDINADSLKSHGRPGTIHGNGPGQEGWSFERVMPTVTAKAIEYLSAPERKEAPFFLFFATTSPHTPIVPTKEFIGKSEAGLYGDYTMQMDSEIGQLLDTLRQNELFDNTLIIFTSDNGPCWYATEMPETYGHCPSGPLRGLKSDTWEGGHRVPFIAYWKQGGLTGGQRIDDFFSQIDLRMTLAELVHVEVTDPKDGMKAMMVLRGQGPVRDEWVIGRRNSYAIRQGEWVLLQGKSERPETDFIRKHLKIESPNDKIQLFNLKDDLTQRVNVANQYPEKVQMMQARLHAIKEPNNTSNN